MPVSAPKPKRVNRLGLTMIDYRGEPSTLCSGCGHDAISSQIMKSFYEMGVNPHRVAKMSGIGCSSKTPAYFLSNSHAFNGVHGRMPSLATGAVLANRKLVCIGVSGDGDTVSIGLGQFCHLLRRNVPMIYIIENNGVYGLTKGQFSATADPGSKLKTGVVNDLPPIDCCTLAIEMGCSYVARSYAGDPKQLVPLLQGALSHSGTSMLDVLSPCVTFNNHQGSTKSYRWAKEHEELLHQIDFVPHFEPIETVVYEEGELREVEMHDGSRIRLRKVDRDYNPTDRNAALRMLNETRDSGEFLTGLIYVNPVAENFFDLLNLPDTALAALPQEKLRPGREALEEAM
ncbi:2-oxoacid:ferredoxin oxidoreductase subunit beta, partial [Acidobacteria bacterium AH-259-G07]|nr:2-oxoacid:ferredoxin oxidoreductase subunit beta [Acidobacteria bacterium AH-259-G07]